MSIAQGCNDILDFLWRQRDLTIFLVRLMFVDANQGLLGLLCWCILRLSTWCLRHSLQPWWMIGWHVGVSFCPTSAARESTKLHRSSIETKTCSALLEQCGPNFSEGGWECVAGHETWDGAAHWSSMSSMLSLSVVLFFVRFFATSFWDDQSGCLLPADYTEGRLFRAAVWHPNGLNSNSWFMAVDHYLPATAPAQCVAAVCSRRTTKDSTGREAKATETSWTHAFIVTRSWRIDDWR